MTKKVETKKVEPKETTPLKGETLFPREEIMKQPSAFDVSPYVLIGAMAEMNGEEYSRSQVLEAIKKFKRKKVKQK